VKGEPMKTIISAFLAVSILASLAFAGGDLARTSGNFANQVPIQFFAPDGTATQSLSVASKTVDLTGYIMYAIWSASGTCYDRLMPTSAKGSYIATPIPNTTWHIRAKNGATPFLNVSGCVGGYLKLQ
jgi:hypothetical protein